MRKDIQDIFKMTPHEKQVMMFSATLGKEMRSSCKKFMQDVNKLPFYTIFKRVAASAVIYSFCTSFHPSHLPKPSLSSCMI